MFTKKTIGRIIALGAMMLIGILISWSVLAGPSARETASTASVEVGAADGTGQVIHTDIEPSVSAVSPSASVWTQCNPVNVAAFSKRVHVKCAAAVSGIRWFAVSTADASNAARVMSLLTAAHISGRTLDILYDPSDTSGTAIGCRANDCRLIQAVGVLQ